MSNNTQGLDDLIQTFALEQQILGGDFERGAISGLSFEMKDTQLRDNAKQAILDWHNKQIEEVLDRLWQHSEVMNSDVVPAYGVPLSAIEAERNKLKESINE